MNDDEMTVSGSGTVPAGTYGRVRISGSARIGGDIGCEELHCSGSAHAVGNVSCTGEFHCSGSFHSGGNLQAGYLSSSGTIKCDGSATAGRAEFSGTARFGGSLKATEIKSSGSAEAADMEAERISVSGGVNVSGLMNAEDIEIQASGNSRIGSIGCGRLRINTGNCLRALLWPFYKRVTINAIEGDDIDISYTTAEIVRGGNIKIGPNCKIGTVEYSGTLDIDASSEVREKKRK